MTTAKTNGAAKKAAPMPEFPAFDLNAVEVPEYFRSFAEKSAEQMKSAYEGIKTAADDATEKLEKSFESNREVATAFNDKALKAAKDNSDATFAYFQKLTGAKTFSEVVELQTSFARAQFETASAQAKDFQDFAAQQATEAAKPVQEAYSKVMDSFKV